MFPELKRRLQQKGAAGLAKTKTESSLPPTRVEESLLPSKGADSRNNSKSEDAYTLSLRTALYNHKRGRENFTTCSSSIDALSSELAGDAPNGTEDANRRLAPAPTQESAQADKSSQLQKRLRSDSPEGDSAHGLVMYSPLPCLLSEEKILSQRNFALHVLAMCMRTTSYFWSSSETSDRNGTASTLLNLWRLPTCVESYLYKAYIGGDLHSSPKGKDDASLEAEEFKLLESVCEELRAKQESVHSASYGSIPTITNAEGGIAAKEGQKGENAECCPELARLIHAIWYLVTAQWRHAVLGDPSSNTEASLELSPTTGWCYLVYLHEHRMLPDAIKFTKGHEVALQLEAWKGSKRIRHSALELLALLLRDYRTISSEYKASYDRSTTTEMAPDEVKRPQQTSASSTSYDSTKGVLLVPADIRRGLEDMIVKNIQNERNFAAARQVYTDMTLGTANWKVGLFSAGEVHMRRSIERVERNRIAHLLNNERAMQMFHSMRELMNVAEKVLTLNEREEFFTLSVYPNR